MGPSISSLVTSVSVLLILSAILSAIETAFVASSVEKVYRMKMAGKKNAGALLKILKNRDKVVSIVLLVCNVVNVTASSVATILFVKLLHSPDVILISSIVTSITIFMFGEMLPKTIGMHYSEEIAIKSIPLTKVLFVISYPVITITSYIVRLILKICRIKIDFSKRTHGVSAYEEIRGMIELSHEEGRMKKRYRDMLDGVLGLDEIELEEIMTHRSDIEAIDINKDVEEITNAVMNSSKTRIPFYDTSIDTIIGVLHIKDFIKIIGNKKEKDTKKRIKEVLMEARFAPTSRRLHTQLNQFLKDKNHMTFVVDEYGTVSGIVTMEDLLEEIVGDISDEHDKEEESLVVHNEDGSITVPGDYGVRDLEEIMEESFDNEDAVTIAGVIIQFVEKIPTAGEEFTINNMLIKILEVEKNSIETVNIKRINNEKINSLIE